MRGALIAAFWAAVLITTSSGLQPDTQYTYEVESRMMTGIPKIRSQFSGMIIEYKLVVQAERNGAVTMKPKDVEVSKVNGELSEDDWRRGDIPENAKKGLRSQLKEELQEPFVCVYSNGVFVELQCKADVPEWIRNWHKSHCSLFQLDLQGRNSIQRFEGNTILKGAKDKSRLNVRESTLQGDCPITYDLIEIPEFVAREQSDRFPLRDEVCPDGPLLRVAKQKNLTDCVKSTAMSFGSPASLNFKPQSNSGGRIQQHTSKATYTGCGNQNNFVPLQIIQEDIVCINPQLVNTQKAIGGSRSNFTLISKQRIQEQLQKPSPSSSHKTLHFKWSHAKYISEDSPLITQPDLNEPPVTPLGSILHSKNPSMPQPSIKGIKTRIVDLVTRCISPALVSSGKMVEHKALLCTEKAVQLLRVLPLNDVVNVWEEVRSSKNEIANLVVGDLFAICGSNPCIKHLIDVILRDNDLKLNKEKTVEIVSHMFSHVITPTQKLLKTILEFTKEIISKQSISNELRGTLLGNQADLIYSSCIHPGRDNSMFPVNLYGLFCSQNSPVVQETLEVLRTELQTAISNGDVEKQMSAVFGLKKLGHPKIAELLLPIVKGELDILPDVEIRTEALYALMRVAMVTAPNAVVPEILSIIQNPALHPKIRTAAVAMMPYMEIPASAWQHIATSTWFDMNKKPHCFFATMVQALASTEISRFAVTRSRARAALPFIKPVRCGVQESSARLLDQHMEHLGLSYIQDIEILGSRSSLTPDDLYLLTILIMGESTHVPTELFIHTRSYSSVRDVLEDILVSVDESSDARPVLSEKIQQIKRHLNVKERTQVPVQGSIELTKHQSQSRFIPFGNGNMRERFRKFLQKQIDQLMNDSGLHGGALHIGSANEQLIAFPSELGFPVQIQFSSPTILKAVANIRGESDPDIRNGKDKIVIPEKLKVEGDVEVGYGWAQTGRLSFFNPLEKEELSVEVHKQLVLAVEGKARFCWKLENEGKKVSELISFSPRSEPDGSNVKLLHFSQTPATVIRKLVPESRDQDRSETDVHPILANDQITRVTMPCPTLDRLGMKVEIKHVIDSTTPDLFALLKNMWRERGPLSILIAPQAMPSVELVDIQIEVKPKRSPADAIVLGWVYDSHSKVENEAVRSSSAHSSLQESLASSSESPLSDIANNQQDERQRHHSQREDNEERKQWQTKERQNQEEEQLDRDQQDPKLEYYYKKKNLHIPIPESSTLSSIKSLVYSVLGDSSTSERPGDESWSSKSHRRECMCKSRDLPCSVKQTKENILSSLIDESEYLKDQYYVRNQHLHSSLHLHNRDGVSTSTDRSSTGSGSGSTESVWWSEASTTESPRDKQRHRGSASKICDIPELNRLHQSLRDAIKESEKKIDPMHSMGLAAILMGMTESKQVVGHLEAVTAVSTNEKGIIAHVVGQAKRLEDGKNEPWKLDVDILFKQPEIPIVKMEEVLNMDIRAKVEAQIKFSNKKAGQSAVLVMGEMERTPDMTEYARKASPEIENCHRSNTRLSSECRRAAINGATLNKYSIKIQHKIPEHTWVKNTTVQVGSALMYQFYPYLRVNSAEGDERLSTDEVKIELRYNPGDEERRCNITVQKKDRTLEFKNVPPLNEVVRAAMPMDLIQLSAERTLNRLLDNEFTPLCRLEKDVVITLDNRTYSHQMTDCYHVVLMDCSKEGNITVLARERTPGKKELQIISGEDIVEVQNAGSKDEVMVNGNHIDIPGNNVKALSQINKNGLERVWLTLSQTKFGEVVLKLHEDGITVATDGARVILEVTNRLRNKTCGMCGDFNREKQFEFRSPQQCNLSNGSLSAASFVLTNDKCQVPTTLLQRSQEEEKPCLTDNQTPKVSLDQSWHAKKNDDSNEDCQPSMVYVTQHIHGKQCNTMKKVPQCPSDCVAQGMSQKTVRFQCIPGEKVSRPVQVPKSCKRSRI